MEMTSKIYVAGHRGLVGSAILRKLTRAGYKNIVTRTHAELDLTNQQAVGRFFAEEKPDYVFLAAAKVGGILANSTYPADFIYQNLAIQTNVIQESWRNGVRRLLFLGSSCIYPRSCPQPMKEEYLLTGPLEPTNRPYAVAKISGIEMCWAYNRQYGTRYLAVMPTNLYGPGDNYDLETSHVIPALIRKAHEAKTVGAQEVVYWGSGTPRREFLHSDDMAAACVDVLSLSDAQYEELLGNPEIAPLINIGTGRDITIRELAELVTAVVGFNGRIIWDRNRPDGAPQKLLDTTRMRRLGLQPTVDLKSGIESTYRDYLLSQSTAH